MHSPAAKYQYTCSLQSRLVRGPQSALQRGFAAQWEGISRASRAHLYHSTTLAFVNVFTCVAWLARTRCSIPRRKRISKRFCHSEGGPGPQGGASLHDDNHRDGQISSVDEAGPRRVRLGSNSGLVSAALAIAVSAPASGLEQVSYSTFLNQVQAESVQRVVVRQDMSSASYTSRQGLQYAVNLVPSAKSQQRLFDLLVEKGVDVVIDKPSGSAGTFGDIQKLSELAGPVAWFAVAALFLLGGSWGPPTSPLERNMVVPVGPGSVIGSTFVCVRINTATMRGESKTSLYSFRVKCGPAEASTSESGSLIWFETVSLPVYQPSSLVIELMSRDTDNAREPLACVGYVTLDFKSLTRNHKQLTTRLEGASLDITLDAEVWLRS